MKKLITAIIIAAIASSANALIIQFDASTCVDLGSEPKPFLYKSNVGGAEEGATALFETDHLTDFTSEITYTGVGPISVTGVLVKFANVFCAHDINWDGSETLFISVINGQNAISHVTLYGDHRSVPDSGASMALLGLGILGLVGARRFTRR